MAFSTLGLTLSNNSLVKGIDFAFDQNTSSFVVDNSPLSNTLCSLFFEKRITEETITKTNNFGGWAGNSDLEESEHMGSALWLEIASGRNDSNSVKVIASIATASLDWMREEEVLKDIAIEAVPTSDGLSFNVKATGVSLSEFSINV